jgi:hypothetical protein
MANSCVIVPSKGAPLFRQLKKQFGYEKAKELFYIAINPKFKNDYKSTLSLDGEGVPSFESFINNSYIKKQLDKNEVINSLQCKYNAVENNIENYQSEVNRAFNFNQTSEYRNSYIATVEEQPNGKLRTVIKERNKYTEEIFKNQYSSQILNQKLSDMFSDIGVTPGKLTDIEIKAGRLGVTDFNVAKSLASDFGSIIRVANNMEGAQAVSEEFAHLIVGCFIDEPLVQRAINLLAKKPEALKAILGDTYEDTVSFYNDNMALVAEEVLGHILQDQMLNSINNETPTLSKRAISKITSKFKNYDLREIEDAINEAETAMSNLAKDVLDGTKTISQADIINKRRDVRLNALSKTIDRNIDILKNALKIEQKRLKLGYDKNDTESLIFSMGKFLNKENQTAQGLLLYAQSATEQLKRLQLDLLSVSTQSVNNRFATLKRAKLYLDSYGQFIKAINNALIEDRELEFKIENHNKELKEGEKPNNEKSDLRHGIELDGQTIDLQEVVKELSSLSASIESTYYRMAKESFLEFIKPFIGNNLTIPSGKRAGKTIDLKTLIDNADADISFMDRWLDSMGESADVLLQLFDSVVKKAKDNARLKTLDAIHEIQKLRMEAEANGITDFSFMFELDNEGNKTGNYISEINYGQYEKDKKEFLAYTNEKYGKNPTGEEAKAKINELRHWYYTHSSSIWGGRDTPLPSMYRNKNYDSLDENHKNILSKFLAIKEKLDAQLPDNKVNKLKAVQIRKSSTQRLLDSMSSPSVLFENIKENLASSILDRQDDDTLFGDRTKSITGFDGKEWMTLPVLYTSRLENPNELSDDVFGSLMCYAHMANTFEQMDAIIDGLETGRSIVENPEQRKVKQTRGNKKVIEKFKIKSDTISNFIYTRNSNIVAKLNDFFESQVYGKYLADHGTFDVFGKKANIQKVTSKVLGLSSFAQLGFNYLANLANVLTGVAMQNIEAVTSQYFSVKELASADKSYAEEMKAFSAELPNRNKKSKLALFDQLFNIKQDFRERLQRSQKKGWFERIFGSSWAFIGQEAGDHWLYNRTAIAMAKRKKVLLNGQEMSLWDALQVRNVYQGNEEIKELNYKDITELDGQELDVHKFSRQVAHINHRLFGIYNEEDANAANRLAMGRLLLQYRKWIKPQMNARFQALQYSNVMDEWEEGYYRTMLRLGNDLFKGKIQLATCWGQMKDFERQNVIRCVTEILQFLVIWGLANWVEWPDDKKRPWGVKLAEYSMKRLAHETGGLTPSTVMLQEQLKNIKDPMASLGMIQDVLNLFNSCITPEDWTDEISSGPYKGLSTLEKNVIKAPLPGVAPYRQIDKFIGNLDNSINYYVRPNY